MSKERRSRRSQFKQLACQYQLESLASRYNVDVFAIADQDGLLLASNERSPLSEYLAAQAPLREKNNQDMKWFEHIDSPFGIDEVVVKTFDASRESLYICAVGNKGVKKEAIKKAIHGIQRIMS